MQIYQNPFASHLYFHTMAAMALRFIFITFPKLSFVVWLESYHSILLTTQNQPSLTTQINGLLAKLKRHCFLVLTSQSEFTVWQNSLQAMLFFFKTCHNKGFEQWIPISKLLNNNLTVNQQINSTAFVESKGWLSCYQESTTGPILNLMNISKSLNPISTLYNP